jgi:hypothetical protein
MGDDKLDDTLDRGDDQAFYRDSFGEKITHEGADESAMPGDDEEMVPDESDSSMEPDSEANSDDGFRESLDDSEPMGDGSSMEEPITDYEDVSSPDTHQN